MIWEPEDWDAWFSSDESACRPAPEVEPALRAVIDHIPRAALKTVADLGFGRDARLPFLVARFARVVTTDRLTAAMVVARRRCDSQRPEFLDSEPCDLHLLRGRLDVAIAVGAIAGTRASNFDRDLGQVRAALVEGGLLVGSFPARPRSSALLALRLGNDDDANTRRPPRFHELELQYRLRKAGFLGVRMRRIGASAEDDGESLLVLATRRELN